MYSVTAATTSTGISIPSASLIALWATSPASSQGSSFGKLSTFKGEPALIISRQELQLMSEPYKNALVGKFPMGRPPMEVLRKFLLSLGLRGDCPIGLLDSKHVLLRPSLEEDFTRLWYLHTWYVQKKPMTISKWTIDFSPNQESSLAPVWITFPDLPISVFFEKNYLLKLGSLIGRPLQARKNQG